MELLVFLAALVLCFTVCLQYLALKIIVKEIVEGKLYLEKQKEELKAFVAEKQAFVEEIKEKIENSKLGSFLNL